MKVSFILIRKLGVFAVAMVVALTGSDAPHAQTQATNQRVWTGTWEEHDSWEGSHVVGRSQADISFVYVEGRDEFGLPRWDSRRLTWSAMWEDHRFDHVWVEEYGEADERGIYSNRSRVDIVTVCNGGGTLELGPAIAAGEDMLTAEQKEQLRPSCVTTYRQREAGPTPAPTQSKRDALPAPSLPNEYDLTGCAYEKMWLMGTRGAGSMSVSVSAPVTAVMEVSRRAEDDYARFVPAPGETLSFTASVPAGTARFRFELDPDATSRFPGYATNANVDDAFLEKHQLDQLPSEYANDDPDVIFHPKHHSAQEWSRRGPLVVETATPESAAVVTVTAMDYGAVGRLRAFVKSEGCGDWQPVPVRFGNETRESVSIPLDDNDNLMADALEDYRSLPPSADFDADPKGNGTIGDGLTAFEEYRGFVTSINPTCESSSDMGYIRTSPRTKDLFIHSPGPILAAEVAGFKDASGLDVHLICPIHYVDNQTRVVNFTMQSPTRATFRGRPLTQNWPQHGLYLVNAYLGAGIDGQSPIGPPGRVDKVEVDLTKIARRPSSARYLTRVVRHELGHAVGIEHHGDGNHVGPIVLLNMPYCPPGMTQGSAAVRDIYGFRQNSQPACLVEAVAVRQGENSGNEECPMKYVQWNWYVPPRRTLTAVGTADFTPNRGGSGELPGYQGQVLPYQTQLEKIGIGKFDHSNVGTGINALRGRLNHAGDSERVCSSQLQVSDAPGSSQPAGP